MLQVLDLTLASALRRYVTGSTVWIVDDAIFAYNVASNTIELNQQN
jgi:hypothetical protein